jgi:5-oxoprolinase (ATP-hydrolysing)
LSNRRRVAPRGIEGGGDALAGVNKVVRAEGTEELVSATASTVMAAGDAFVILTPGGGGYGYSSPLAGRGTARSAVEGVPSRAQTPLHQPSAGPPPLAEGQGRN